ncbi:efflux RND transporter periplasmic adaptor subunit, partial [Dokdonella sp.]|uniref:efflux RND transporter periplasmic adaptor subunit n=1 Tax=Dokdonella sp. TaxID=2291710 RepID=UPI003C3309D7
PDQHFDKPGKSPFMDMDLVPKYADTDSSASIRVSAATAQNLGVRIAVVEVGTLAATLSVPGNIGWNLRESREVSARVDGIVEKLAVRSPFEEVRAGQPLAEFISPAWSTAAQEYLALEGMDSEEAQALRPAARQRLRAMGMDDAQIRNLSSVASGVVLRSPIDGVVSALMVREGQRVQAGTSLMTINGLDTVWAEAAIPQAQVGNIRPGMSVNARASAFPGEVFSGAVEALIADVDATTRTQGARIVLENPARKLVPGLFVDLQFDTVSRGEHPLVPDAALIATGVDTRVILSPGDGRFVPVRVVAGHSSGGRTEILEGLIGGERVVVSGQFLLDSEASLSGALDRLSAEDAAASGNLGPGKRPEASDSDMQGHDMQGHDMQGHDMQGHDMQGHDMQGHDMSGHDMHKPADTGSQR